MHTKIVLLNPPPNITFQLRKPLVSPDIVGIHFYQPIFNTPFISYYQVVKKGSLTHLSVFKHDAK